MSEGKTALVLSAGGMFGAYQAGVWDELSALFSPDVVVGASVGSLNGWMIASGCQPSELIANWRELHQARSVRWRVPRRFGDGLLDSQHLEDWIRQMCTERRPQAAYGVVLTELRTLTPRLFGYPDIQWQHIAASCSVPVFLTQHRIAGRYYSDGGLLDPLPLWGAVQMGATSIICVNLLKHRPWSVRQMVRALQACGNLPNCSQQGIRLVDISPTGPLGSARDSMYWSAQRTEMWIEQGRQDARAQAPAVIELVSSHRFGRREKCPPIRFTG